MQRSSILRWNHPALLCLLLAGCAGQEVQVGGEVGMGLDRCGGTAECGTSTASKRLNPGASRTCSGEVSARLETDFRFDVNERLCPWMAPYPCGEDVQGEPLFCLEENTSCSAEIQSAKAAPDGSIWVAATTYTTRTANGEQDIWLGHVGADGADLGFHKLASGTALRDNTVYYQADLAVDAQSHAYVAISGLDPGPNADAEVRENTWLEHYDAQGRSVDGKVDLPGLAYTKIAMGDDGRVVLLGHALHNEQRAIVAVLERDGSLAWSHPAIESTGSGASGALAVGVDAAGNVFVYTTRADGAGIVRFDRTGTRRWERVFVNEADAIWAGGFSVDAQGNVSIVKHGETNGPWVVDAWVASIDSDGDIRWFNDLAENAGHLSVTRDAGEVSVLGHQTLVRISSAGECTHLAYAPDEHYDTRSVEIGADGHVYFVNQVDVGRYKLVPLESAE